MVHSPWSKSDKNIIVTMLIIGFFSAVYFIAYYSIPSEYSETVYAFVKYFFIAITFVLWVAMCNIFYIFQSIGPKMIRIEKVLPDLAGSLPWCIFNIDVMLIILNTLWYFVNTPSNAYIILTNLFILILYIPILKLSIVNFGRSII